MSAISNEICDLISNRLLLCIPLGLDKIWFKILNEFSIEGLGNLLGYGDYDFNKLIKFSSLPSLRNNIQDSIKKYFRIDCKVKYFKFEERDSKIQEEILAIRFVKNDSEDKGGDHYNYGDSREVRSYNMNYGNSYDVRLTSRIPNNILEFIKEGHISEIKTDNVSDVTRIKLNIEDTLYLQRRACLSDKQRLLLARVLKILNNGVSVLADEKDISKMKLSNKYPDKVYETFVYYLDPENLIEYIEKPVFSNTVEKRLQFYFSLPRNVLEFHLDSLFYNKDKSKYIKIGMVQNNDQFKLLPLHIYVTIVGEYDGEDMKITQVSNIGNEDKEMFVSSIGNFSKAEPIQLPCENIIFPQINASINELSRQLMILVVEWNLNEEGFVKYYFDYLFYPKDLFDYTIDSYYRLPSSFMWKQYSTVALGDKVYIEGVYNESFSSYFKGPHTHLIPTNCRVRNINIICFSTGSLFYQFKLSKRDFFQESECLICDLTKSEWQPKPGEQLGHGLPTRPHIPAFKNSFNKRIHTRDSNLTEIDRIQTLYLENVHNDLVDEFVLKDIFFDIKHIPKLLLPDIENSNIIIPVLELKYRLVLKIFNKIFLFIAENLESETEELSSLRLDVKRKKKIYIKSLRNLERFDDSNIEILEDLRQDIIEFSERIHKFDNDLKLSNKEAPTIAESCSYEDNILYVSKCISYLKECGYGESVYLYGGVSSFEGVKNEYEIHSFEKQQAISSSINTKDIFISSINVYRNKTSKSAKIFAKETRAIFNNFGIITNEHNHHKLSFDDCECFLLNYSTILLEIRGKWINLIQDNFHNPLFTFNNTVFADIDGFICNKLDALESLDFCSSILESANNWFTSKDIKTFQKVIDFLQSIWDHSFEHGIVQRRGTIPLELHLLRSHAHQFLSKWHNIGKFLLPPLPRNRFNEDTNDHLMCTIDKFS